MILAGISDIDEGELTVHGDQELISINTGKQPAHRSGKYLFKRSLAGI